MSGHEATVSVVDDDAAVRCSLARLVRSAGLSVETFASAREFLERPPYSGVGCVVLDVLMPEMSGPELHTRMSERGLSLPVVFLTGHGEVPVSVQAMKKGAVDFLLKPVDDAILLQTVHQAVVQHVFSIDRQCERKEIGTRLSQLSSREREVMELVIRGRLNKQIAADLGISEKTVKAHRGRVMEKMEVRSIAALVHLCEAAGILARHPGAEPSELAPARV